MTHLKFKDGIHRSASNIAKSVNFYLYWRVYSKLTNKCKINVSLRSRVQNKMDKTPK